MKTRVILLVVANIILLACVSSALAVPTATARPETKTPAPTSSRIAPSVTPNVTVYIVTASVLEIRDGAGEKSVNIGYLLRGDVVEVLEVQKTTLEKCQAWARIYAGAWVCMDRLVKADK